MSNQELLTPPLPAQKVVRATLLLGDREVPVVVALRTVTSAQDGRACWEGDLWSNNMPFGNLKLPLTLRLPDGREGRIHLTQSSWEGPIPAEGYGLFRSEFLSDYNYKD